MRSPTMPRHARPDRPVAALAVGGAAACSTKTAKGGGWRRQQGQGGLPDARRGLHPLRAARPTRASRTKIKELCRDCKPLYNNADGERRQAAAAVQLGARPGRQGDRHRSGRLHGRRIARQQAQAQGVKVIAYDRPIPTAKADFYVSFDNEAIGKSIASRSSTSSRRRTSRRRLGRPARGQRLADRRRRRPDQEGHPRGARRQWLPDARRVRHARLGAGEGPAVGRRPDLPLRQARSSASSLPTTAPAAARSRRSRPPASTRSRPSRGNDATIAGLQLIIAGDQYNTISKPSEIVAGGGRRGRRSSSAREARRRRPTPTLFGTPDQAVHPDARHRGEPQGRDHRQERSSHRRRAVHGRLRGRLPEARHLLSRIGRSLPHDRSEDPALHRRRWRGNRPRGTAGALACAA